MKIFLPVNICVLKPVCADWTSLINGYSSICQLSINSSAPFLYTANCSTVTVTQAPYLAVVKLGFCTEQEFNNLTATVCGRSDSTKSDSTAKLNFYNVLNLINNDCKRAFMQSISNSVTAIVFKQQEMYCQLSSEIIDEITSRYNPNICFSSNLTSLQTAACSKSKTDVDQKFSTAILSITSTTCQNRMSYCATSGSQTIQLILAMQYCEYLNSEEVGTTTKSCLRSNNACTLSEIIELQYVACSGKTSVISILSSACRLTIRLKAPNLYTADCNAVSVSQEKYLTLVKLGFCTEREFQNLTAAACGSSSSTKTDSTSKLNFYNAIIQVSTLCQQKSLACFNNSVNAIVLKQQEQYCSLMNLELNGESTEDCLKPDCTLEEFFKLQSAACSVSKTDVDQTFSRAMLSTWSTCQNRIYPCDINSPHVTQITFHVLQFLLKMQYCEAMNLLELDDTRDTCWGHENACTSFEIASLKEAACGTAAAALTSTNVITSLDESSVILADTTRAPDITTVTRVSTTATRGSTTSAIKVDSVAASDVTSSSHSVTKLSLCTFIVWIGHVAVKFLLLL